MLVQMRLSGLDGTLATLQSLPAEIVSKRGGPVKLALAKAARVIRDEEKRRLGAVIRNGGEHATGLLEANVVASRGKAPAGGKGERYLVRVRRKAYPGRHDRRGAITVLKSAALLEYGSSKQLATPWVRPAFAAKAQTAIDVFVVDVNKRIVTTVKRLAAQNTGKK